MKIIRNLKITVTFENPPIPVRNLDYTAVDDNYDGPGSPIGTGSTPREAVEDLFDRIEQIEDDHE